MGFNSAFKGLRNNNSDKVKGKCREGRHVCLLHGAKGNFKLGSAATRLLGWRVRIPPVTGMSVVSVVCCQVEVSASGSSFIERSSADRCVIVCDLETSIMRRPWLCPLVLLAKTCWDQVRDFNSQEGQVRESKIWKMHQMEQYENWALILYLEGSIKSRLC